MKFLKYIVISWVLLVTVITIATIPGLRSARAATPEQTLQPTGDKIVNVYLFWAIGCPHCTKEKDFFAKLVKTNPTINLQTFEVSKNTSNAILMSQVGEKLQADVSGVPFTVIGSKYFTGYRDDETTGELLKNAIADVQAGNDFDILAAGNPYTQPTASPTQQVIDGSTTPIIPQATDNPTQNPTGELTPTIEPNHAPKPTPTIQANLPEQLPKTITLPLIGALQTAELSLPVLSIVIGLTDGFNPCAMWTLIFLISLLLDIKDRKRMWLLGTTFIVTSAFIYFIFMAAWLNLFLFIGLIFWIRILIGMFALGAGTYHIKEFYDNRNGGCKVTKSENRKQIFARLRDIVTKDNLYLALAGIALLAIAVNLVEAICSAGLPAIFTQVLALSQLPLWKYYAYILLYLVFFMLDDMIVFVVAMTTLQAIGIQSKYGRYASFIGGVIMILIGISLLFKPELLMFG